MSGQNGIIFHQPRVFLKFSGISQTPKRYLVVGKKRRVFGGPSPQTSEILLSCALLLGTNSLRNGAHGKPLGKTLLRLLNP